MTTSQLFEHPIVADRVTAVIAFDAQEGKFCAKARDMAGYL
jgi:hypothetical protein